jgi:hypothetical protein
MWPVEMERRWTSELLDIKTTELADEYDMEIRENSE